MSGAGTPVSPDPVLVLVASLVEPVVVPGSVAVSGPVLALVAEASVPGPGCVVGTIVSPTDPTTVPLPVVSPSVANPNHGFSTEQPANNPPTITTLARTAAILTPARARERASSPAPGFVRLRPMSAKHLALLLALGAPACGLYLPGDTAADSDDTGDEDLLFVAAGDQGALLSSPDGVTWTTRTSGTTVTLHDITYGDGRYVAVGQGGKILVSDDGVVWTNAASPSSRDLLAVVHHIDRFYAVGGDYSAGAETLESMDGSTWTRPEITQPLHVLGDLASDGADLVAIGKSMSDLQIFGLFTWDAATGWTQRVDGTGLGLRYNAVAAGAPAFVTIGAGGSASSTDTITWTQAPIFESASMRGLTYTQQGFIAVGDTGKVLLSSDGAQWTAYASGFDSQLADVTSSGTLHITVGNDGAILSSGDGALWLRQSSPLTGDLLAVTHPRG